ncbi:hypothetical protein AHMF7605_01700 [Adhaeribacter arboris]|uniref:eCIS core domain-containing protein n=1 Tax=Adhaeribacter arboris TaxID=2072846 RepID=A0A2T2Y9Y7_9BACT|nr:DUF4157 domain-containing protein [Adhaeribacter arboris]PSR52324.1 hypothetical protein AHMF7605_01700 [Adhaeribacter arboris]
MFSTTEKTSKSTPAIQQKAADTSFFKKTGEEGFFGRKETAKPENTAFFNAPVQAKLKVSSPDDPQEKEADAVTAQVMRMPEPVVSASVEEKKEEKLARREEKEVQRNPEEPTVVPIQAKEEAEPKLAAKLSATVQRLARKAAEQQDILGSKANADYTVNRKTSSYYPAEIEPHSGRGSPNNVDKFEQTLAASKGGGSALPNSTRQFMENRFGADFSGVRIHTGSTAENLSSSIQAQAFAHGNDIYFNQGKFSPDSASGCTLLAHELTHTIQQNSSYKNKNISTKQTAQAISTSKLALPSQASLVTKREISRKQSDLLYRAPAAETSTSQSTETVDISNKSGGSPLPADAQEFFQDSYGADVRDIRVHVDAEAAAICRARRVPAFTQGGHICFEPARYAPTTEEGGALLAKQVSHSLAQRSVAIPGLLNQINTARQADHSTSAPAKSKQPENKERTTAKDKNKAASKEKEVKPAKGVSVKPKGKRRPNQLDGPPVKSVKANPKKSPTTPEEDPAFQKAVGKAKAAAKNQKQHEPADAKATDAQKAAPAAPKEAESKAQERKTGGLDAAGKNEKPFDEKSFKADLLKKIEEITPETLEEATEFKENNKIGEVKNVMGEKVSHEKQATTGPVTQAAEQPLQVNEADSKKPLPLPPTHPGTIPGKPVAQDAAPKPKLNNEISLQEQSKSLDDEMKAHNVTEEQLTKSNEPSFAAALSEKKGAQKDAAEKPQQYRKAEGLLLNQAKATVQAESIRSVTSMHTARGKNFNAVVQHQQTTKQKDQERRAAVAKEIEAKYAATEEKVKKALEAADTESNQLFEAGSEAARKEFEDYVAERMSAYKRRRYSGFWGGLRWAKDKIFGMPDEVNAFYTQGRQLYLNKMDQVITQVAHTVTTKLNEAKQAITDGKKAIDEYVSQLPKDLVEVGKEAASTIQDKFEALEQSVNDKRDELIEGLAKKYVDNVKKLDDRITEMKEANQGLIDKAIGFLKKVWQIIKDLTNLFTSIFAKLASIIGVVLSDPGGFFDNLGKAFSLGFNNFKKNFLGYLEQGLMDWLKTNLGIAGLEIPKKFDPAAIFSLALQVMGITKEHIRERAVALLGKRKVELLEGGGELLARIYKEGLGVIWDIIYEKLRDFKEIVWEAIKSFLQTKIIEAALTFLLSMLNPIGAFIKVCMAIYDFLMMLVRFKDRIMELLDTILNAVTNIASGAIDGAAKAIEGAFAKSIPVIIGFLAALLHLNDIAAKIRDIIMRVKGRVEKAIDWVLQKAVGLVKGVGGAVKTGVKGLLNWLGLRKTFTSGTATHTIYFAGNPENPELMIATNPKTFAQAVTDRRTELSNDDTMDRSKKSNFRRKLTDAEKTYTAMNVLKDSLKQSTDEKEKSATQREVFRLVDKIIEILVEVGVTEHDVKREVLTAPVQVGDFVKQGSKEYEIKELNDAEQRVKALYLAEAGGTANFLYIDYGKSYSKIPQPSQMPVDEKFLKLNAQTAWDSYAEANKVLNYRRSGFQLNNDDNYQWEHTVEHSTLRNGIFSSRQVNSQTNLAWASTSINQEVNRLYTTYDRSKIDFLPNNLKSRLKRPNDQGIDELISIREYLLLSRNFAEHEEFKRAYYRSKGVSVKPGTSKGFGFYQVLS